MRVYVIVEGQTEEAVVKDVLVPHLEPMAIEDTGLMRVRERCPRFDEWIATLEALAENQEP